MPKKPCDCTEGSYFFDAKSAAELRDRLNRGNVRGIVVRIDAHDKMTQAVLYEGITTAEGDPPVNDSHRCPGDPACP